MYANRRNFRVIKEIGVEVTSDFRAEVEIRPFRTCAMHPAIIIGTVRSLWTWLWGRYHVPQNAFLVSRCNWLINGLTLITEVPCMSTYVHRTVLKATTESRRTFLQQRAARKMRVGCRRVFFCTLMSSCLSAIRCTSPVIIFTMYCSRVVKCKPVNHGRSVILTGIHEIFIRFNTQKSW